MADSEMLSRQSYLERVERVRAHIRANLDEPLDLDVIAEIACLSRFHWHRIYHAMTGETVAHTVRRLRLARAADDLAQSWRPLSEVAGRAGYTSQSAFTRAFTSAHGMSPAEFREAGMHAVLKHAIGEDNAMAFKVDIRVIPSRPAIGLLHNGAYNRIGELFERLFSLLGAQGLMSSTQGPFGRYRDSPDDVAEDDLRSHACVFASEVGQPLAPLEAFQAGGGTYAVLTYEGPYSAMKPAYDWMFGVWLPNSGREPRDDHVLEINLNTPMDTPASRLLTEICLPIED